MKMSLEARFLKFCRQYPGAENIDDLVQTSGIPPGVQIADFLFQGRTIVCEVKTFTTETVEKLVAFMKEVGLDPSNLPSGQHIIEQLFLQLDDSEKKYQKAKTIITKPLADGLDNSERQIRSSKQLFGLPDADGLLVILNDKVVLAGPPLIAERLAERLAKSRDDGSPYHKNINHILHIGEIYSPGNDHMYMDLTIPNPRVPEAHGVKDFVGNFMKAWAAFNGHPLIDASPQHQQLLRESRLFIDVKRDRAE